MAQAKLSRRKIAAFLADELIAGRNITQRLASYLIETKRIREVSLFVREIESALAERGTLIADVAGSHELSDDTRKVINDYLKDKTGVTDIHLREHIDPSLLGGVRIETPGERLDSTIRERINKLHLLTASNT